MCEVRLFITALWVIYSLDGLVLIHTLMFHLNMEIWMNTILHITINKSELYKIKECKICVVNIDLYLHNKQSETG